MIKDMIKDIITNNNLENNNNIIWCPFNLDIQKNDVKSVVSDGICKAGPDSYSHSDTLESSFDLLAHYMCHAIESSGNCTGCEKEDGQCIALFIVFYASPCCVG